MFKSKVVIVVGGGSGIGREAALLFGQRGGHVLVADIDRAGADETTGVIAEHGGDAFSLTVDGSEEDQVAAMVDAVVARWGRLDCAFNNVGHPGPYAPLPELSLDEFERCQRLNATSCFLAMKHEIPAMLRSGGGTIVNTASLAGLIGNPSSSAYVAAKHAVVGLTKTAALEFATRNIRVNAICPGATDTPMLRRSMAGWNAMDEGLLQHWVEPMGRFGKASEQAEAAVWLCSDQSSFVTGHIMPVDGGHMAGNRATNEVME